MKLAIYKRISLGLLAAMLALPFSNVETRARPDATTMTCAQAKAFVKKNAPITMSLGGGSYQRIVPYIGSCDHNDVPRQAFGQTKDKRNCPIGFYCQGGGW